MRRTLVVSDLLVGVASVATAIVLYVARPAAPRAWIAAGPGGFAF